MKYSKPSVIRAESGNSAYHWDLGKFAFDAMEFNPNVIKKDKVKNVKQIQG